MCNQTILNDPTNAMKLTALSHFLSSNQRKWSLVACLIWLINGCSSSPEPAPSQPEKPITPVQPKPVEPDPIKEPPPKEEEPKLEDLTLLEDDDKSRLERALEEAQQRQDWQSYLIDSERLWHISTPEEQAELEQITWLKVQELDQEALDLLAQSTEEIVQAWLSLQQLIQKPASKQARELALYEDFYSDLSFSHHLLPSWQTQLQEPLENIAVLLPLNGPYKAIATQIRDGMIRYQLQQAPKTQLQFYNVEHASDITQIARQAIEQGAQALVGPVTKEAITQLANDWPQQSAEIQAVPVIALNQVANTPFKMFNFKTDDEAEQIVAKLGEEQRKHLGLLTSTAQTNIETATAIQKNWLHSEDHYAVLKTYPTQKPNLRKALGSLINEEQSQARKHNLRWLFKQNPEFTPRTRQDLEAIVLLGNSQNLAVFKPQFEFFDLSLPIYGTSNLTPKKLLQDKADKDLAGVTFPTFRAAMAPSPVTSVFEAYGWDALLLAAHPDQLTDGQCHHQGLTGDLKVTETGYGRRLQWGQYNAQGELEPLLSPSAIDDTLNNQTASFVKK